MFLIRFITFLLKKMPRKILYLMGDIIGLLVYYIHLPRRRVAETNLKIVLKDKYNKKILKENYRNIFRNFMEIFFIEKVNDEFIKKYVKYENLDDITKIKNDKKPTLLLTGHIGSWELLPIFYTKFFNHKVAIIGKEMRNKKIDIIIKELRSNSDISFISHGNVMRIIHRYLNKGIPVGALLDQGGLEDQSIFIDFFGLKTTFVHPLLAYAVRKEIKIIMVFLIRENEKYRFINYPPIYPNNSLDYDNAVIDLAKKINEVYEDIIIKYPTQWFTLNKRFKRVKNDEGEICSIY
ncbi:MAG: hypothetical protein K6348_08360 [Deferribacterales bacterium]